MWTPSLFVSSALRLAPLPLPIEPVLPALIEALANGSRAVLEAPPGAGKTTRVPLALLDAPWRDGRIVMLEPRRLAARAAARRMAQTLGEPVGRTVGYAVRHERVVSRATQIEVVTEGMLTRRLQSDPTLDGVSALIFDEFHERNLPSDLGLALALDMQTLRPELRIVVMSATLDGARVAALLAEDGEPAPLVRSEGRLFPVETRFAERPVEGRIEDAVARSVRTALAETEGDVLVFLPGAGEIRRTEERLAGLDAAVLPLHGSLPIEAQDAALAPNPRRKVVLATDIAETSLTIEGMRVVVDAGLARRPRYDAASGMERLETVPIAQASAEQRRGRAGRLAPGVCFRLWTAFEHAARPAFAPPEIATTDLAPLALELAAWGTPDPSVLRWLDPPPKAAYAEARTLLTDLGALDRGGALSPHGRALAALGMHPRLAHLALRGRDLGLGATACRLAALLDERDVLGSTAPEPPPSDLRLRLDLFHAGSPRLPGLTVHRAGLDRVRKTARMWQDRLNADRDAADAEAAGLLLALAYPDRLAQRLPGTAPRFRLRDGRPAELPTADPLADAPFLAVGLLTGRGATPRIALAAPLDLAAIEEAFGDATETAEAVAWDDDAGRVVAARRRTLGALILSEGPLRRPDPQAVAAALLDGVRARGLGALPWSKDAARLRERLAFLHHHDPTWPDVSDEALLDSLDAWLGPYVAGMMRLDDLRRLDLPARLLDRLDWAQRADLDRLAPSHVTVPSGSHIPIDYAAPEAPVLAVRLQEVFGLTETPRVFGGRVPLTMHLLSPAHRPAQVTQDLASFWREGYFDVRRDLRGRYPKHYWPDDPLEAEPTRRAKPRR